jgi:hypothetical protein
MQGYEKFCYWFNQEELERIGENLKHGEITMAEEAHIPCRALRSSLDICLVLPRAWQGFCRRRTSWYGSSQKAGRFLIVSNRPLPVSEDGRAILLRESNFKPDRLPTFEEVKEMAASRSFQKKKPSAWDKIDFFEKDFYRKWFERLAGKDRLGFEEALIYHSANHANFLDPKFFILLDAGKAPYSIADSLHACSSCLEFFNILGGEWPIKYVTACSGAVRYARLPRDQYFSVCDSIGILQETQRVGEWSQWRESKKTKGLNDGL